jgi:hypothetical protein
MGIASFGCTVTEVVDERWDARGRDIGIRHQIPVGIKEWMRIEGFKPALCDVMNEWIDRRLRGAQKAIAIIGAREEPVGVAPFARAAA